MKQDYWQSNARSAIGGRCASIFNQELMSDVRFVIRDSHGATASKEITAHKFVLAISSPVFYAMFYGELAETKDSVEISDCDYGSLLELFRFIYSDEANLTPDNVMQLMYLAKKYMLPSLADKCSAYLQQNVDVSNVFHVLQVAQKYEEKEVVDHCWKVIERQTEEAVKSDSFVTIERSVLEELVNKEPLNIKEIELFKAVDHWAGQECEKQGLVAEGSEKRRILGERVISGIRFPVMEQKEFVRVVLDCDILTKKECYDMVKYFNVSLTTPVGFSENRRRGPQKIISRFRSLNFGLRYPNPSDSVELSVSVDRNITLHALRLFGSKNSEYSVAVIVNKRTGGDRSVRLFDADKGKILSSKLMQSEMGNYQGFEFYLKRPILLKRDSRYYFRALISGPPSWFGESSLSEVKHSGVTFTFDDLGSTTGHAGQFPEFLFTLV